MNELFLVVAALVVGGGLGWLGAQRGARGTAVVSAPAPAPVGDRAELLARALAAPAEAVVRVSGLLQEDAVFLEQHDLVPDLLRLREAGEQIQALVLGLLDLNALERGDAPLVLAPVAVDALVARVVAGQRRGLSRSLVEVQVDVAPGAVVQVDVDRIERALGLLLGARIARVPQGRVRLSACVDTSGLSVRIAGDEGEGVNPHLESLFSEPSQLRSADAPAVSAVYLARGLAAAHGGVVRWEAGAIVLALPQGG